VESGFRIRLHADPDQDPRFEIFADPYPGFDFLASADQGLKYLRIRIPIQGLIFSKKICSTSEKSKRKNFRSGSKWGTRSRDSKNGDPNANADSKS